MTQPTHDEVIAWIDREVIEAGWSADSPVDSYFLHHQSDIDEANRYRASLLANQAGLERHKPTTDGISTWCGECGEFKYDFPCPTYTDVFTKIVEVMG